MKIIGTVLPTAESLAAGEVAAKREAQVRDRIAVSAGLKNRVCVCGEARYYESATVYAIVGRDNRIKRFEIRSDGEYRI